MFTWESGRVLTEHHLVYISRGSGEVETRRGGRSRLSAGDLMLLHKGEWHRYRPSPKTGWDESWVGFDGEYADHLMSHFFTRKHPLLAATPDDRLLALFREVAADMQSARAGFAQVMAARTVEILARLHAERVLRDASPNPQSASIHRARLSLLAHYDEEVDLQALARELGMSYSTFRRTFKAVTGSSPRRYQLQIRLNRGRALLVGTDWPVSVIAERTGFSSVHYFSRYFKESEGVSPAAFRKRARGE
jgi:AraC-like DNA-binding protein